MMSSRAWDCIWRRYDIRLESISQAWYSRLASGAAQPNHAKLSGSPSSHWRTREEVTFGFLRTTVEPKKTIVSQW
jgi:hypothetical protein